jgi:hypothetical protein
MLFKIIHVNSRTDKDRILRTAGLPYAPITIPAGAGFTDMVALKDKSNIGDQINKKTLKPLANAYRLSDMPYFNDATVYDPTAAPVRCC